MLRKPERSLDRRAGLRGLYKNIIHAVPQEGPVKDQPKPTLQTQKSIQHTEDSLFSQPTALEMINLIKRPPKNEHRELVLSPNSQAIQDVQLPQPSRGSQELESIRSSIRRKTDERMESIKRQLQSPTGNNMNFFQSDLNSISRDSLDNKSSAAPVAPAKFGDLVQPFRVALLKRKLEGANAGSEGTQGIINKVLQASDIKEKAKEQRAERVELKVQNIVKRIHTKAQVSGSLTLDQDEVMKSAKSLHMALDDQQHKNPSQPVTLTQSIHLASSTQSAYRVSPQVESVIPEKEAEAEQDDTVPSLFSQGKEEDKNLNILENSSNLESATFQKLQNSSNYEDLFEPTKGQPSSSLIPPVFTEHSPRPFTQKEDQHRYINVAARNNDTSAEPSSLGPAGMQPKLTQSNDGFLPTLPNLNLNSVRNSSHAQRLDKPEEKHILSERAQLRNDFVDGLTLRSLYKFKLYEQQQMKASLKETLKTPGDLLSTGKSSRYKSLSYQNPEQTHGRAYIQKFLQKRSQNELNQMYWNYQNLELKIDDQLRRAEKIKKKKFKIQALNQISHAKHQASVDMTQQFKTMNSAEGVSTQKVTTIPEQEASLIESIQPELEEMNIISKSIEMGNPTHEDSGVIWQQAPIIRVSDIAHKQSGIDTAKSSNSMPKRIIIPTASNGRKQFNNDNSQNPSRESLRHFEKNVQKPYTRGLDLKQEHDKLLTNDIINQHSGRQSTDVFNLPEHQQKTLDRDSQREDKAMAATGKTDFRNTIQDKTGFKVAREIEAIEAKMSQSQIQKDYSDINQTSETYRKSVTTAKPIGGEFVFSSKKEEGLSSKEQDFVLSQNMEPIIIEATNEDGSAVIIQNEDAPVDTMDPPTVAIQQDQEQFSELDNRNVTTQQQIDSTSPRGQTTNSQKLIQISGDPQVDQQVDSQPRSIPTQDSGGDTSNLEKKGKYTSKTSSVAKLGLESISKQREAVISEITEENPLSSFHQDPYLQALKFDSTRGRRRDSADNGKTTTETARNRRISMESQNLKVVVPHIKLTRSRQKKKRLGAIVNGLNPLHGQIDQTIYELKSPIAKSFKFEDLPAHPSFQASEQQLAPPPVPPEKRQGIKRIQGQNHSNKVSREKKQSPGLRKTVFTPPKLPKQSPESSARFQFMGVPRHHMMGQILQTHRSKLIKQNLQPMNEFASFSSDNSREDMEILQNQVLHFNGKATFGTPGGISQFQISQQIGYLATSRNSSVDHKNSIIQGSKFGIDSHHSSEEGVKVIHQNVLSEGVKIADHQMANQAVKGIERGMSPARISKIKKKIQPPSTVHNSTRKNERGKGGQRFSLANKISTENIGSNFNMARKSPKFTNVTSSDQLMPLNFNNNSASLPARVSQKGGLQSDPSAAQGTITLKEGQQVPPIFSIEGRMKERGQFHPHKGKITGKKPPKQLTLNNLTPWNNNGNQGYSPNPNMIGKSEYSFHQSPSVVPPPNAKNMSDFKSTLDGGVLEEKVCESFSSNQQLEELRRASLPDATSEIGSKVKIDDTVNPNKTLLSLGDSHLKNESNSHLGTASLEPSPVKPTKPKLSARLKHPELLAGENLRSSESKEESEEPVFKSKLSNNSSPFIDRLESDSKDPPLVIKDGMFELRKNQIVKNHLKTTKNKFSEVKEFSHLADHSLTHNGNLSQSNKLSQFVSHEPKVMTQVVPTQQSGSFIKFSTINNHSAKQASPEKYQYKENKSHRQREGSVKLSVHDLNQFNKAQIDHLQSLSQVTLPRTRGFTNSINVHRSFMAKRSAAKGLINQDLQFEIGQEIHAKVSRNEVKEAAGTVESVSSQGKAELEKQQIIQVVREKQVFLPIEERQQRLNKKRLSNFAVAGNDDPRGSQSQFMSPDRCIEEIKSQSIKVQQPKTQKQKVGYSPIKQRLMHLSLGSSVSGQRDKVNKRSSSIRVQTDNSHDNFQEVQNLLENNANHFGVTFLGSSKQVSDRHLAEESLESPNPESKYPILIDPGSQHSRNPVDRIAAEINPDEQYQTFKQCRTGPQLGEEFPSNTTTSIEKQIRDAKYSAKNMRESKEDDLYKLTGFTRNGEKLPELSSANASNLKQLQTKQVNSVSKVRDRSQRHLKEPSMHQKSLNNDLSPVSSKLGEFSKGQQASQTASKSKDLKEGSEAIGQGSRDNFQLDLEINIINQSSQEQSQDIQQTAGDITFENIVPLELGGTPMEDRDTRILVQNLEQELRKEDESNTRVVVSPTAQHARNLDTFGDA